LRRAEKDLFAVPFSPYGLHLEFIFLVMAYICKRKKDKMLFQVIGCENELKHCSQTFFCLV